MREEKKGEREKKREEKGVEIKAGWSGRERMNKLKVK